MWVPDWTLVPQKPKTEQARAFVIALNIICSLKYPETFVSWAIASHLYHHLLLTREWGVPQTRASSLPALSCSVWSEVVTCEAGFLTVNIAQPTQEGPVYQLSFIHRNQSGRGLLHIAPLPVGLSLGCLLIFNQHSAPLKLPSISAMLFPV